MNAKEFLQSSEQAEDVIAQVRDDTLRTVLTKHYAGGQTWEQIAEELHYTPRHIQRLHKKALAAAQDVLNEQ